MSRRPRYPEDFVVRLEAVWGEGFLSPGGPAEVAEIVRGLDLRGRRVLDIGSGVGGPAVVLVRDLGAGEVVGIDVEAQLVARARALAERAGVAARVAFRLVEPGPLPFPDASFDLVFSKDSLVHVADKAALFREIRRVLRPDGVFAASDWLRSKHAFELGDFRRYLEVAHLDFAMATAAECREALAAAGFVGIATRDRNAWYAPLAAEEVRRIEGELRGPLIAAVGEEIWADWLEVRRRLAAAVACGGLRPTHLRAHKPRARPARPPATGRSAEKR